MIKPKRPKKPKKPSCYHNSAAKEKKTLEDFIEEEYELVKNLKTEEFFFEKYDNLPQEDDGYLDFDKIEDKGLEIVAAWDITLERLILAAKKDNINPSNIRFGLVDEYSLLFKIKKYRSPDKMRKLKKEIDKKWKKYHKDLGEYKKLKDQYEKDLAEYNLYVAQEKLKKVKDENKSAR